MWVNQLKYSDMQMFVISLSGEIDFLLVGTHYEVELEEED